MTAAAPDIAAKTPVSPASHDSVQRKSPVFDGEKRAWYQSIAGKLLLAFSLIAALTVSATWLSVIRFRQIEAVIHRMTDVSLPAVKLSLGIQSAATEVVAAANNVAQAENDAERFRRMDALSEQIGSLWSALAQLQSIDPDTATTSRLQELIAAIDSIVGGINRTTGEIFTLTEQRRKSVDSISAKSQSALELIDQLSGTAHQQPGMTAAERPAGTTSATTEQTSASAAAELRTDIAMASSVLHQAAVADSAEKLAVLRERFSATREQATAHIAGLEGSPNMKANQVRELRQAVEALFDLGSGGTGLFAAQERFLLRKAEALTEQKDLLDAEDNLRKQIAMLVGEAEHDANTATELSTGSIASSLVWLVLIAVASLGIAVFIVWKFVLRYVVTRLTNLAHSMLMIARGNLGAPIPAAGPDELGDMSRALLVFRDNAREIRVAKEEAEKARTEAEAASRTKSAFLANMSHELRTPLNAIIGYSELLVEDATDRGDSTSVEDLQKIQGAGKHLLGLINGILDLSKIEAGRMDIFLEQIYLARLIEEVRAIVEPLVKKNGNLLIVHYPSDIGSMRTDLTKLKQSLINLLSNAAKFTSNGQVQLDVSRERQQGHSQIIFRISDTGIGMSEEQLGRLFQAFSQADSSTTRNYGGTGLGLTISRHFAVMLGGSIEVTSKPGEGSTFTLMLPDQSLETGAQTDATLPVAQEEGDASALTVLVVDDDPTVHDVLSATLTREGYRVLHARDGAEALEILRKSPPDIVTLDVMMPKVDGWSVLGTMKSDAALAHIPVIMVTIVDDRNLGYSLGASEFMTKPIDRPRLVELVRRFTGKEGNGLVLIVDDDAEVREIARSTLQAIGLKTAEAINGRAALEWLDHNPVPALVLLDLMMPEMDGFEFIQRLRERKEFREIPVVVLTAKELTEAERAFLAERTMLVLSKSAHPISSLGAAIAAIAKKQNRAPLAVPRGARMNQANPEQSSSQSM